ncbi:hypothetical protein ERO13_A02G104700v2 [Gossypium hirsutum]|uniref:Late embryogenesis abundant protein At1g64065-like n=6 Tax=Gossypium TaxID=3633 RepID=A0ABR0R4F3_GOSAR|nr:late embryogenesis abundant protein At1g64065 [Gossypium hirsutum]XP_017640766.1 late embryogenesis abundant protein At1g64065-like [Gossypium arboreum]KAB2093734.1 hypothetical protein ES319_A02G113200v1 [Gossypium barbadense]TYH28176.1 hypothetical protein ES288_A02G124400v1 [Gossypium darwinii]TYI39890.1 hypothetical protein ES332_A02G126200v1 [Gossypium tomentosum]TYJ46381.1 hypothetical protein E1A91_A02G117200v1 [Gossypium mustelinum]KAG4211442.1 hypothetical protein ERO13_A02G104700
MQEDPQAKSLEPIEDYPRSDMVFGWIKPKQDKKSSKCLVYILVIMVIQGSILLVLANIFLRARTPDFEIGSVKVRNLKYGNSSVPSFNFTLVTQVTVENTNFGEFRFDKSTGTVWCGSEVVALMKIPKGIAQARATEKMKVSINWWPGMKLRSLAEPSFLGPICCFHGFTLMQTHAPCTIPLYKSQQEAT